MTVSNIENVPVFNEATTVLVCRKLFTQKLDETGFIDRKILEQFYSKDSMHSLYIAEIEKILVKE